MHYLHPNSLKEEKTESVTPSKGAHSAVSAKMLTKERRSSLRSNSERNGNYKAIEYKLQHLKDNPKVLLDCKPKISTQKYSQS